MDRYEDPFSRQKQRGVCVGGGEGGGEVVFCQPHPKQKGGKEELGALSRPVRHGTHICKHV